MKKGMKGPDAMNIKHVADMANSEHHGYLKDSKEHMKRGHKVLEQIPADQIAQSKIYPKESEE